MKTLNRSTIATCAVLIACGLSPLAASSAAAAGILYATSTDATGSFVAYDPIASSWSTRAPISTNHQITADRNGIVYAHDSQSNQVKRYDPLANAWIAVIAGPTGFGGNGVLAVLNDGRIVMTRAGTSELWVNAGGAWTMTTLGFTTNRVGDYDPERNQLVLGQSFSSNGHLMNLADWSSTVFGGGGSNGEWARLGEVANGFYFFQDGGQLTRWDLSNNALAPTFLGNQQFYPSGAIDRDTDVLYVLGLGGGDDSLQSYGLGSGLFAALPGAPTDLGYHSTAVVGGVAYNGNGGNVPIPATLALVSLGLPAIVWRVRRPRRELAAAGAVTRG